MNRPAEYSNDSTLVKEQNRRKNMNSNVQANRNYNKINQEDKFISKDEGRIFILGNTPPIRMKSYSLDEVQGISSLRRYVRSSRKEKNLSVYYNRNTGRNSETFYSRNDAWNLTDYDRYSNEESLTLKGVTTILLKKSSVYALNQIGNSKTWTRKLFWSFIMMVGLFGCGSQIFRYLNAFFKYPVVVNIDSLSEFSQVFPGVTLCNFNTVRKSYIPCLIKQLNYEDCNVTTFTNESYDEITYNFSQPSCFGEDSKQLNPEDLESAAFYALYSRLNEATRQHYGHQAETFIRSCSFMTETCSYKDFSLYLHPFYGNCFTFNSANQTKPSLNTSFIGPNGALDLEMDLETEEYFRITKAEGARIFIHDPYHGPNPEKDGLYISPGFQTAIGVSLVSFHRLRHPYKDQCASYQPGDNQQKCLINCVNKIVYSFCSCELPSQSYVDGNRVCDLTNGTEICCMFQSLATSEIKCHCPLECEESTYETKISSAVWPSTAYTAALLRKEIRKSSSAHWKSITVENLRKSRLKLSIYYDTLQHLIYRQRPMFDDSEVLSQIGGQMGLWLGLSLVAIFECVENLVLIWRFHNKRRI
ncbi:degenerin-like protein asic-2 [Stegodyphus dumicola]|uniref:degenerin-like protein asic-2 n=1 Tax=Stegodyphus dumicola TaxID=202533 RepID=UPI0015B002DD|nr:degenerin-like protein asic-2 [Stegodyphus dumicola]